MAALVPWLDVRHWTEILVSHMYSSDVQGIGYTLISDEVSLPPEFASDPDGEMSASELDNGILCRCSFSMCAGVC